RTQAAVVARTIVGKIVDVVSNLIRDAQGLAVPVEDHLELVAARGEIRTDLQRDLKRRRRLLSEDVQDLERRERLRRARPAELRSLPERQRSMSFGRGAKHRGAGLRRRAAGREEAIAFA